MFKHILIPTDGSAVATKALDAGIEFAREAKAKVTFFTAVPEYQIPTAADVMSHNVVSIEQYQQQSHTRASQLLDGPARRARAAGVECDVDYTENDHPYRAIIDAARSHGCDLIVMSSHGRSGLSGLWHGSETRDVLVNSDIPTLVYR